jgi:hypothetical protein
MWSVANHLVEIENKDECEHVQQKAENGKEYGVLHNKFHPF